MQSGKSESSTDNVLIKQSGNYEGLYVAMDASMDGRVISQGKDMVQVHDEAVKKGVEHPVVFFVPKKNGLNLY